MLYHLSLLGRPTLDGPEGAVRPAPRKAQALLWYLAAYPDRTFSRSHLVDLLWENFPESAGRQSLSSSLNRLRLSLPVWPLQTQGDHIGWAPDAAVETDVARFHHLVNSPLASAVNYAAAVALVRGSFMEGFYLPENGVFDAWLEEERQQWDLRFLSLLGHLVEVHEAAGYTEAVIQHARRALALDPLQERFHRALMVAHYQGGDRGASLAQFQQCRRVLLEHLGVEPDPTTLELRDAIIAGSLPRRQPVSAEVSHAQPVVAVAPANRTFGLLGRTTELAWLEGAVLRAAGNVGGPVLVEGEFGIGKTRLVAELMERLHHGAAFGTVVQARCREATVAQPFAPMASALATMLLPEPWATELGQILPGLHCGDRVPPAMTPASQTHRARVLSAMAGLLRSLPGPVLLLVEDLQWADAETATLLDALCHLPVGSRLALLMTVRPGPVPAAIARLVRQWTREQCLERIRLGGLSPAELAPLAPGRAEELHRMTHGNPLFATALADVLPPVGTDVPPLPASLQQRVRDFVAELPAGAGALAAAASLFPGTADFVELCHMTGQAPTSALPALELLLEVGLLEEGPGTGRLSFRQPLAARVVREGLSYARRQILWQGAFGTHEREAVWPNEPRTDSHD